MNAKTILLLSCAVATQAALAQTSWWPPHVLLIEREEVLAGKMAQYEPIAQAYAAALDRARVAPHRIALNIGAGGDRERVYLTGYESMDALENARDDWGRGEVRAELQSLREKASEVLASRHTMIAVYRADLSYRPTGFNYSEIRYVLMSQHQTTPEQESQYVAGLKNQMDALAKAEVDRHWYVYRTIVGAPPGTGFMIEPFRSLAELDPFVNSPGGLAESTYYSAVTPEIGIYYLNHRASYPK